MDAPPTDPIPPLPAFDPERFRATAPADGAPTGRRRPTIPVWILVVLTLMAFAAGVAIGVAR